MATPVILPRQGQSVESCIITEWNKKPGDTVQAGDILFTYETDKATFEEESKIDGTMLGIFFEEGDDVPVLTTVCVIGNAGENFEEFRPALDDDDDDSSDEEVTEHAVEETAPQFEHVSLETPNEQVFASPRAKNKANDLNVDVRFAAPTGPNGRVIERDIVALAASGARATSGALTGLKQGIYGGDGSGIGGRITTFDTASGTSSSAILSTTNQTNMPLYEDVKLTNIRKAIAKNMMQSLQNSAQLTHHITFDATDIMAYRKQVKANAEKMTLPNITLNDMVMFAVSRTLTSHRDLNAHYLEKDGVIRYFNPVNLGIAVDTERGLLVPTLLNAHSMTLSDMALQTKELAREAQNGSISPDLLSGATFTISNLGSYGVEMFTPVINPPQTGILGVCGITQRVRDNNGAVEIYPAMGLSLTYDHRALDGAPASRFLQELVRNLENFSLLLSK